MPVSTVPGIMAFQELAASTGTVLAEGDERIDVGTMGDERHLIRQGSGRRLDPRSSCTRVADGCPRWPPSCVTCGRLDGAVIGELMGLPGGRNGPVEDVAERPASYLATVVVPATAG